MIECQLIYHEGLLLHTNYDLGTNIIFVFQLGLKVNVYFRIKL